MLGTSANYTYIIIQLLLLNKRNIYLNYRGFESFIIIILKIILQNMYTFSANLNRKTNEKLQINQLHCKKNSCN